MGKIWVQNLCGIGIGQDSFFISGTERVYRTYYLTVSLIQLLLLAFFSNVMRLK